jgi:hypothetical protein
MVGAGPLGPAQGGVARGVKEACITESCLPARLAPYLVVDQPNVAEMVRVLHWC